MVVKRKERLRWILKQGVRSAGAQVSPVGEMGIREVKFPTDIVTFSSSATYEGYDTEETATLLGLTPDAVKTRSHRGFAALKSLRRPIMRGEGL